MSDPEFVPGGRTCAPRFGVALVLLTSALALSGATRSENVPMIPKWGQFEQTFRSSATYSNALQQVTLTALFRSPLGETNRVDGFWDGGSTWRVRFSPDQAGRWTYETFCSDPANAGLRRTGAFLCTAAAGTNRFRRQGPVRVARDHRHFEHANGRPFFWLADAGCKGARLSEAVDWERYAASRAAQGFTAAQWSVAPGPDSRGQTAFSGRDLIEVNPEFFKRLDARVTALNQAGLLSVIAPIAGLEARAETSLPESQATLLLRYMVARWGSHDVAWLLVPLAHTDHIPGEPARYGWKQVGRAVFGGIRHATVMVVTDDPAEFREETWVDAYGYDFGQNPDDLSLQRVLSQPVLAEWKQAPARPLIGAMPPLENGFTTLVSRRIEADDVRRAAWRSLLAAPIAGVSYGAEGVANWKTALEPARPGSSNVNIPGWQKSLFLPGARNAIRLAEILSALEFWRLLPEAAKISPNERVAAARTEARDLVLVYLSDGGTLELFLDALPPAPVIEWINPRTGERTPAVAVVEGRLGRFPAPEAGDWLLIIKAGK